MSSLLTLTSSAFSDPHKLNKSSSEDVIASCVDHLQGYSIALIVVLDPSHTVKACFVGKSIVQPLTFTKYGSRLYLRIIITLLNTDTKALHSPELLKCKYT